MEAPDTPDEIFEGQLARVSAAAWERLASTLAVVEAEGAPYAEWSSTEPTTPGGPHHFPFPRYTPAVGEFRRSFGNEEFSVVFDWMRWPGFTERWDAARFANASAADALRLLVTATRGERFSDGFIESLLARGILQAAALRLLELRPFAPPTRD